MKITGGDQMLRDARQRREDSNWEFVFYRDASLI